MSKVVSSQAAAARIADGAVVTVSSSSALGCPDAVLAAIGERFRSEGHPRDLTTLHPIAAGDMYGVKGIDHIAQDGLLARVIAGSYPSGSSNLPMPEIWKMIVEDRVAGLQRALRHPVRHAPRGGGAAAGRADQGRARHLRRPGPRGLRDERRGGGGAHRARGWSSAARPGCTSPTSCPTSASCAPPRRTSAAT